MMQLRDEMMMVDHIILLGEYNLERRFARWLLMMAKFYSDIDNDQIIIISSLTHSDIAAWIGLSRETVGKLVHRFTDRGHIKLKQKRLRINNIKQLEGFLQSGLLPNQSPI
jgi:CRP-like cAMP-binding protein